MHHRSGATDDVSAFHQMRFSGRRIPLIISMQHVRFLLVSFAFFVATSSPFVRSVRIFRDRDDDRLRLLDWPTGSRRRPISFRWVR